MPCLAYWCTSVIPFRPFDEQTLEAVWSQLPPYPSEEASILFRALLLSRSVLDYTKLLSELMRVEVGVTSSSEAGFKLGVGVEVMSLVIRPDLHYASRRRG